MDRNGLANGIRTRGREALDRRIGIDPRALAALRVSVALLVLADLTVRTPDLVAFYTDGGVFPRAALLDLYPALGELSLHALSGAAWFQVGLFGIAAAFAGALLIGYRTTLVAFVSLVLLVSLHLRNPVLLNAGDALLRRLLLWGLFLPLAGRWSIDALRRGANDRSVANVASAALLLQVVIVYTVNGVVKLRGEHWVHGDALRYVFGLDQLTVLLGETLAGFPVLLELFDWVWLVLILSSGLLVLLTGRARTLLVVVFAAAHLAMALTLRLGLFPLISIAALLPFLPPSVWDGVERRVAPLSKRIEPAARDWPLVDRRRESEETANDWRSRARAGKRRLAPPVVAVLLVLLLFWNTAALGYASTPDAVASNVDPEEFRWDMFAPDPRTNDGWFVVPAELESGRQVDAFHGSEIRWDRPPDLERTYPSHRWFLYLVDLSTPAYADLRPYFADYLCDRWNGDREDELVELTVYYVEDRVRLDEPRETHPIELYEHTC